MHANKNYRSKKVDCPYPSQHDGYESMEDLLGMIILVLTFIQHINPFRIMSCNHIRNQFKPCQSLGTPKERIDYEKLKV